MRIAIVLISYNQEKYIYEALEGIRLQSISPDEVVISDDCSKDNTQSIIQEYVRTHGLENKWKLLFNSVNIGINRNFQKGIDHTTAEIIVPMAGDDISLPNRCEEAYSLFLKHPNIQIVTTGAYKIDSNGKQIGVIEYQDELRNDIKRTIKAGMPNVFPVGQSWRRTMFEVFGKIPVTVPNEDDQITFWGLLNGGIFCSSNYTVKYRVHNESASSWLRNNQSDREYFLRFVSDMPVRRMHMELWRNAIEHIYREDHQELASLIQLKIETYAFMEKIADYNFVKRWQFLKSHNVVVCFREKYYLFLGKLGVISWRWIKKILNR